MIIMEPTRSTATLKKPAKPKQNAWRVRQREQRRHHHHQTANLHLQKRKVPASHLKSRNSIKSWRSRFLRSKKSRLRSNRSFQVPIFRVKSYRKPQNAMARLPKKLRRKHSSGWSSPKKMKIAKAPRYEA